MRRNRIWHEEIRMLYFQAWELMRKREEKQVRKADLQEKIWGREAGWLPEQEPLSPFYI